MDWKSIHCSVCEKPLQEGEDIVVCPECGAPYHRECYVKNGKCIFSAQHGGGFEYKHPTHTPDGMRCHNCGTPNEKGHLFCENCGTPLADDAIGERESLLRLHNTSGTPASDRQHPDTGHGGSTTQAHPSAFPGLPEEVSQMFVQSGMSPASKEYDGISTADWIQYIGNSAPYYLFQFDRMDKTKRKTSVCWSALFLGPIYFFYRKMWSIAFLTSFATALISIPTLLITLQQMNMPLGFILSEGALSAFSIVCALASWGLYVFQGLFAFYLYRRQAVKKLRALKASSSSAEAYHVRLTQTGGPSRLAVAALFVALFALSMLFTYWVGPDRILSLTLFS